MSGRGVSTVFRVRRRLIWLLDHIDQMLVGDPEPDHELVVVGHKLVSRSRILAYEEELKRAAAMVPVKLSSDQKEALWWFSQN